VEVALSLILVGLMSLVLARSASSYLGLFRMSHAVSDLSQREWLAASRMVREVREAYPPSLQVDPDGLGFSFNAIRQNGIVEEADRKNHWFSTLAPGIAQVPAGARLLVRHKQANTIHETTVTGIECPKSAGAPCRIHYPKGAPGLASVQTGDRFWVLGETVSFRKQDSWVVRSEGDSSGSATTLWKKKQQKRKKGSKGEDDGDAGDGSDFGGGFPLVASVSRFGAARAGASEPLRFDLFLADEAVEVGGTHVARPWEP